MLDAPADDDPGFLASAATTLRLMLAWACVAIGVLDLGMGFDLDTDGSFVVFHLILLLTGGVLMGWGRLQGMPGRIGATAGCLVTAVGLVISTVSGFPFPMGGADLVFWASTGVLTAFLVAAMRPAAGSGAAPDSAAVHAEKRAADAPVAHDENVGGLP